MPAREVSHAPEDDHERHPAPAQRALVEGAARPRRGTWIAIAFVWCLVMFFMMPYWHVYGKQNLSNEAYRTTPEALHGQERRRWSTSTRCATETDARRSRSCIRPPAATST